MSDGKIYIGKIRTVTNKFGKTETKIALGPEDLKKLTDNTNEKGWVNVVIKEGKNGDPYGSIDTWKPNGAGTAAAASEAPAGGDAPEDDLPF